MFLGVSIVIISSLENQGVFRIDPATPITSQLIVLTFNQYGARHYDLVRYYVQQKDLLTKPSSCRCGVNKKIKSFLSCVHMNMVGQYASQCICLCEELPCHDLYKCINCGNPYRRHSTSTNVLPGNERVHQQHELAIPLPVKKFMERKRIGNKEWSMDDVGVYGF